MDKIDGLKSEAEIIKKWKNQYKIPLVNVMCLTYNHEKYIEDALQGFLIQKTDFPFEVLIHEDASTDKTAEIIRKYEKLYPNIIKPVYQTENQWTKDKEVIRKAQYDRVKGKYLAYCEGDDYWTDPYKLQKQVDYMEANPDYVISFNRIIRHFENDDIKDENFPKDNIKQDIFDIKDLLTKRNFIPTLSVVFRAKHIVNTPEWFESIQRVDWYKYILCAQHGKIKMFNEVMGVQRIHTGGVWSGKEKGIGVAQAEIKSLFALNKELNFQYSKLIKVLISKYYLRIGNLHLKNKDVLSFIKYNIQAFKINSSKIKGFKNLLRCLKQLLIYFIV